MVDRRFFRDIAGRLGTVGELLLFFSTNKWWWLTPVIVILVVFGVLIVFAQTSAIVPFIYMLF